MTCTVRSPFPPYSQKDQSVPKQDEREAKENEAQKAHHKEIASAREKTGEPAREKGQDDLGADQTNIESQQKPCRSQKPFR
jgi:hypothetical protein